MTQSTKSPEDERQRRLRELMDRAIVAERENPPIPSLINTIYEASVRDRPGPARRATVRGVEAGLMLLEYEGSPPEQYWVPLANIQWLKVIR